MSKIVFIGGGNMASAMVGGLVASGIAPTTITVVDPNATQRAALEAKHGILTSADVTTACAMAETIILATKPQVIPKVAEQLKGAVDLSTKLLLSIAAGTSIARLETLFGPVAVVRTMPNTPALLGLGATGIFCNARVSAQQRDAARQIVEAFGICVPVKEEALLDAVTAVSGSGPAYFFLMIEEMAKSGTALGLDPEEASKLAVQTALGAASMAASGSASAAELRRQVTSPNGTTHAAIKSFESSRFGDVVLAAMTACRDRAVELNTA